MLWALWAHAFYVFSSLTVLRHLVSLVCSQTTSQGYSVQLRHYTVIVIMLLVWCTTKSCVCVLLVALFKPVLRPRSVAICTHFISLASCDSVRKNIQDASHVICYLHFILSVSCILTLCRYIVQKVVQKVNGDMFWRDISCVHTVRPPLIV